MQSGPCSYICNMTDLCHILVAQCFSDERDHIVNLCNQCYQIMHLSPLLLSEPHIRYV